MSAPAMPSKTPNTVAAIARTTQMTSSRLPVITGGHPAPVVTNTVDMGDPVMSPDGTVVGRQGGAADAGDQCHAEHS